MPKIEVGFGSIVGDKNLPMLKRRHRPRIDIQVRVELHQVHLQATAFEQATDRSCGQPLA